MIYLAMEGGIVIFLIERLQEVELGFPFCILIEGRNSAIFLSPVLQEVNAAVNIINAVTVGIDTEYAAFFL